MDFSAADALSPSSSILKVERPQRTVPQADSLAFTTDSRLPIPRLSRCSVVDSHVRPRMVVEPSPFLEQLRQITLNYLVEICLELFEEAFDFSVLLPSRDRHQSGLAPTRPETKQASAQTDAFAPVFCTGSSRKAPTTTPSSA